MNKEEFMKKVEKRRTKRILSFLVPLTVLVVLLTIVVGVMMYRIGDRKTAGANDFISAAKSAHCEVYDIKNQIEKNEMFENVLLANVSEEENSTVVFFEFKKSSDAKSYFASSARTLKTEVKNAKFKTFSQKEYPNYCYYTAIADGKFLYVVRVKDTVIYVTVPKEEQEKVQKIINELGY